MKKIFEEINKQGYYLIVVPYQVPPANRATHILKKFIEQTRLNPGQPSITDYI